MGRLDFQIPGQFLNGPGGRPTDERTNVCPTLAAWRSTLRSRRRRRVPCGQNGFLLHSFSRPTGRLRKEGRSERTNALVFAPQWNGCSRLKRKRICHLLSLSSLYPFFPNDASSRLSCEGERDGERRKTKREVAAGRRYSHAVPNL